MRILLSEDDMSMEPLPFIPCWRYYRVVSERGEQEATARARRITAISTNAEHSRGIHTPRAEEDPWC